MPRQETNTQVSPCDARVPYCRRRLQTHQYPCRRHHVVWKSSAVGYTSITWRYLCVLRSTKLSRTLSPFSYQLTTVGNGSPAEAWAWNSGDDNTKKWVPQGITSSADAFFIPTDDPRLMVIPGPLSESISRAGDSLRNPLLRDNAHLPVLAKYFKSKGKIASVTAVLQSANRALSKSTPHGHSRSPFRKHQQSW
jgi:hypothetical protein